MRATSLDGRAVADAIAERVSARVAALPRPPKLVFVRVGEDPASASYVRSKQRLARRVGVEAETLVLPEETDQATLMASVVAVVEDEGVDGVLVQLPLPAHLDEAPVLEAIDPDKDVDGFHAVNVGRLWSGLPGLVPCTPLGLEAICDHYGITLQGQRVVIVGRSNLVGKPAAALFLRRHATVTLAHSRTRDLGDVVREADVVVAAVGRAGIVQGAMVKPGAAVLDVGMSRVDGKIVGDVAPDVWDVAGAVTPMPGGTGLVTVAMVVQNTVSAAERRIAAAR
ncbi:MAG: bifunctional 5,10-methylene-tetrahydrofolate dehydrogenase/5,10-methylene-tetrahydrofolate cyclohydrolase [Trueperaceae bacterium]|nr:MAG: bifunctional 5,10-methylene-tetrahydrofolate dehydrogenase/5,10-methylene-tetrahydrofolate cyclohydrolase [Trueperaceae bacterium]